jgi:hypothetical protein
MKNLLRPHWILAGICLFALLVRLPTIGYGLPYHLYGDEETNIYGALQMLQLHTALPVLHAAQFDSILYEPPVTAYLFALAFIPTLAVDYALQGFPSLTRFKELVILDPSIFWLVARGLEVLISILSIVLLYRIGKRLFHAEAPALLGSAFFATSFLTTTLAATARHWTIGVFFGLAALWYALEAYEREAGRSREYALTLSGILLGTAFGAMYAVYFVPLLLLVVLYQSDSWRTRLHDVLTGFLPFCATSLLFLAVAPFPFASQVLNHVTPGTDRSLTVFLAYYGRVLWEYETPLVVAGLLGLGWLTIARRELLVWFGTFFVAALTLLYFFSPNLGRYLVPILPILALMAGYGLWRTLQALSVFRFAPALIVGCLIVSAGALYGRYEIVMLRDDVRTTAHDWVSTNIPQASSLLLDSDKLRFFASTSSLAVAAKIAPESLRAADRLLLAGAGAPHGAAVYDVYPIALGSAAERLAMLSFVSAHRQSNLFLISDMESSANVPGFSKSLTQHFSPEAVYDSPEFIAGGGIGVDPQHDPHRMLWDILYGTRQFGAPVSVYTLTLTP